MSHPFTPVKELFAVHRLTGGRCLVIGEEVDRMATDLEDAGLGRAARRLVARAEDYDRISVRRRVQRNAKGDGRASEVDRVLDNVLRMMHGHLEGLLTALDGEPQHPAAVEAFAACFPEGLGAVVKVPYEDELIQVRRIETYLGKLDPAVVDALGVRWHFTEIERLLPEYAEALASRRLVTAGDVSFAREALHAALCALVGYVVALYFEDDALPTRDALLAPVFEQQARLSALMRARRLGRAAATPAEESDSIDALLDEEDALDAELDAADAQPADAQPADAQPAEAAADLTDESDDVQQPAPSPVAGPRPVRLPTD